jgi:hypothetical protein
MLALDARFEQPSDNRRDPQWILEAYFRDEKRKSINHDAMILFFTFRAVDVGAWLKSGGQIGTGDDSGTLDARTVILERFPVRYSAIYVYSSRLTGLTMILRASKTGAPLSRPHTGLFRMGLRS